MSKWEAPGTLHLPFSPRPLASHVIDVPDSPYPGGCCVVTWSRNPGTEACDLGCERGLSRAFTAARADLTAAAPWALQPLAGSCVPRARGVCRPARPWFCTALFLPGHLQLVGAPYMLVSGMTLSGRLLCSYFPLFCLRVYFLGWDSVSGGHFHWSEGVACLLCVSGLTVVSLAFQLCDRGSLIPALLPQDSVAAGQLSA